MKQYPFYAHDQYHGDGKIRIRRLPVEPNFGHQHIFFELVYVLQGSAIRVWEDTRTPIKAGDYCFNDPHSIHWYENTDDLEIISCMFMPEYIDRALVDCPSLTALISNKVLMFGVPINIPATNQVYHDPSGMVRKIVKDMEKEQEECQTGYKELLRCYLTQVLVCAARACEDHVPHKAISKVTTYLKEHYSEPLCMKTLGELVGYTPQYLSQLFKEEMGMNIQSFFQQLRMEEACRLLSGEKKPTADVAAALGYRDTRFFSKVFRRYKGMSPQEYWRRQQQQE